MPIMEKRCSKNRRTGCACSLVAMPRESECMYIFALCIQPILEMSETCFRGRIDERGRVSSKIFEMQMQTWRNRTRENLFFKKRWRQP